MKQKDKKKNKRNSGRLTQVIIPDDAILDDLSFDESYKCKRNEERSVVSYKEGMDLKPGRIVEIKSNYAYIVEVDGLQYSCILSGRLKQYRMQTKGLAVVGDKVDVDFTSAPVYRIETVSSRKNKLSRFGTGTFQKEIIIAANIDQVIITVSIRKPMIKPGLIDRYLCAAALFKIDPLICINKMDLCDNAAAEDVDGRFDAARSEAEEIAAYYRQIGIPVLLVSATTGEGMEDLQRRLKDQDSLFTGQSGTGKTSIINYLEPGLKLPTAEISNYNEKGKHTTTQAILLPWSFSGHLIDTPGIKTITLHQNHKSLIPTVFPGFHPLTDSCGFRDCTHTHESHCAVKAALDQGALPLERYLSYLRIMDSL